MVISPYSPLLLKYILETGRYFLSIHIPAESRSSWEQYEPLLYFFLSLLLIMIFIFDLK